MKASGFIIVYITAGDEAEARKLAGILLENKKAACVNIIPKVASLYRWQGRIEDNTESLLIIKTRAALLDDIATLVKASHSYETPEIIAVPVIGGSPDYLAWLDKETT
ncbi:MAG: divalent-cation tolerance protein CutA [Dehalococcoidia bacterium]|nr:divalent-cation tolerance protein CutA [Dehalococcoidia bacterium]